MPRSLTANRGSTEALAKVQCKIRQMVSKHRRNPSLSQNPVCVECLEFLAAWIERLPKRYNYPRGAK
jgi:hypothetical protein